MRKRPENIMFILRVNHAANGKMYLYDVVGIKKEASNPLKTNK